MGYPPVVLFDDDRYGQLLPLTFTRPAACLRSGILTQAERWEKLTGQEPGYLTSPVLQNKYRNKTGAALYINGRLLADETAMKELLALQPGQSIWQEQQLIACYSTDTISSAEQLTGVEKADISVATYTLIQRPWDLFSMAKTWITADFLWITSGKQSAPVSATNTVIGKDLFIEPGAQVEAAVINTTSGPVYIGKDAEVMEGSMIRGPFALGDHSTLKMGAKIYGATSIGPHCKVGGEVNNSMIFGFSNKAHDGFLGNSVIGEWCNLGADTNNSNLKNNYAEVRMYDYLTGRFIHTGLQFCGLIMGDHSKCGINTMFNTGTVVGVNANIFGDGFPRNFIPSFSWGGAAGFTTYKLADALTVAEAVMQRRGLQLNQTDKDILTYIFESTRAQRQ